MVGRFQSDNNSGELTALMEALVWISQASPDKHKEVELVYDSEIAAGTLQGSFSNKPELLMLADTGIHVLHQIG